MSPPGDALPADPHCGKFFGQNCSRLTGIATCTLVLIVTHITLTHSDTKTFTHKHTYTHTQIPTYKRFSCGRFALDTVVLNSLFYLFDLYDEGEL